MAGKYEVSVKDKTKQGQLSQTMTDFLKDLKGKITNDISDRALWTQKMVVAQNQRLGVKRVTDYPYVGAPDIPLPETDKLIKKQVPNLALSSWSQKNMCLVRVAQGFEERKEWKEKAKKAQSALNSILRSRNLGWFKKLCLAADFKKTYGHCLFRVREEFRCNYITKVLDLETMRPEEVKFLKSLTDEEIRMMIADRYYLDLEDQADLKSINSAIKQFRAGETFIEFEIENISSFPNVDIPIPTKIIVPSYTTDITQAQRVTYEYFLSQRDLELLMESEVFRKKDLKSLAFSTSDNDIVEKQKMLNEGVSDNSASPKELYRIHETLTWYREDEGDTLRRWLFVTLADCTSPEEALLQDNDYPYTFDEWNYDKCDEEIKDPRYFSSRGVPEQNRAYQEVMERAINNMLIRDEMINSPMWEVLGTSELMQDHIKFVPGQKLPVRSLGGEIAPIGQANMPDMASDRILQLMKGYVEEYQSSNDYLFRNSTNAGGGKTLGEINFGVRQNAQPIQLEVIAWNECLSNVYQKMFEIMKDRLGESMWIDGVEITQEDFNFPAEVKANGDLEVADAQFAAQKAVARIQVISNPLFRECVNTEDKYNALVDWLEKDGVKDPNQFCTDPKEMMRGEMAQLQQQLQQMQQQLMTMKQAGEQGQKELMKQKQEKKEAQSAVDASSEMITENLTELGNLNTEEAVQGGLNEPGI